MDREAEIAQCDKMMGEFAELFITIDNRYTIAYAKEMYGSIGRGFLTYFFNSISEAREFIRATKINGRVTAQVDYWNISDAKELNYPDLVNLIDKYNPRDSYVVLVSIDLNSSAEGLMRADAMIVKP